MSEPKCESCGTPWTEHLGIMGTCQRLRECEAELSAAAAILQEALPIGQVKHIGLLEVAAGVRELAGKASTT